MRSCKFTAVDTVVVVLVCVFAAALLVPVCGHARGYGKEIVCLSNLHGLSQAWLLYAEDNDGALVGGSDGNPDFPYYAWVGRPDPAVDNLAERQRAIMEGLMFDYVGATSAYHCPSDRRYLEPPKAIISTFPYKLGAYRSYSIAGGMKGVGSLSNGWRGWEIYAHTTVYTIKSPENKYVFVEEADGRGWNWGSWVLRPQPPGEWVDPLAIWHNRRSILGFADGHAEAHKWVDQSTFDMSQNQVIYQQLYPGESGEDIRYMVLGYAFERLQ